MTGPDERAVACDMWLYAYGPDPADGQARVQQGRAQWDWIDGQVQLWCTVPGGKVGGAGETLFRALWAVRVQLHELGWTLLVRGASRYAWDSTPQYPCGEEHAHLYRVLGQPPQPEPVHVLDAEDDPDNLALSVVEHLLYRQEWAGETPAGGATWSEWDRRRRQYSAAPPQG